MERFAIKIDQRVKLNLYNICRLCGIDNRDQVHIIEDVLENSVNEDEPSLCKKVLECVGIQVAVSDKMPQKICLLCVDKINDFYEYREMCKATNSQTRELLGLPPELDENECILSESIPGVKEEKPLPISNIPLQTSVIIEETPINCSKRKRKLRSEEPKYEESEDEVTLPKRKFQKQAMKTSQIPGNILGNKGRKSTSVVKKELPVRFPHMKVQPTRIQTKVKIESTVKLKVEPTPSPKQKVETSTKHALVEPKTKLEPITRQRTEIPVKQKPFKITRQRSEIVSKLKQESPNIKSKDELSLKPKLEQSTKLKTEIPLKTLTKQKSETIITRQKTESPALRQKFETSTTKQKGEILAKQKVEITNKQKIDNSSKQKTEVLNKQTPESSIKQKLGKQKLIAKQKSDLTLKQNVKHKIEPSPKQKPETTKDKVPAQPPHIPKIQLLNQGESELLSLKTPNKRERQREIESKKKRKIEVVKPILEKLKTEPMISCIVCPKEFKIITEYDSHFFREHTPNILEHGCSPCREAFYDLQEFRDHQLWHRLSSTPFKCFKCNSEFDRLSSYSRHFLTSCIPPNEFQIVDNIKCKTCRATFVTPNLYDWHDCFVKNNSKCRKCGKFFIKKVQMIRHVVSCEGDSNSLVEPPLKKKKTNITNKTQVMATTHDEEDKIVKIEPGSIIEIEKESQLNIPSSSVNQRVSDSENEDDTSKETLADVGFQEEDIDDDPEDEDDDVVIIFDSATSKSNSLDVAPINENILLANVKQEKIDKRYGLPSLPVSNIPMVQIKQEIINQEYVDLLDDSILKNIKPEPSDETVTPSNSKTKTKDTVKHITTDPVNIINSTVSVIEKATTLVSPIPASNIITVMNSDSNPSSNENESQINRTPVKPTLKLKIKKEHGTLNSSFIDSDPGEGDSSPNPHILQDQQHGHHHHKKRNKHKKKIYKIPKRLAMMIQQEKAKREAQKEQNISQTKPNVSVPMITDVTSIRNNIDDAVDTVADEIFIVDENSQSEDENDINTKSHNSRDLSDVQLPLITNVSSLEQHPLPLISSVTSLSDTTLKLPEIRVKMEFNSFDSPSHDYDEFDNPKQLTEATSGNIDHCENFGHRFNRTEMYSPQKTNEQSSIIENICNNTTLIQNVYIKKELPDSTDSPEESEHILNIKMEKPDSADISNEDEPNLNESYENVDTDTLPDLVIKQEPLFNQDNLDITDVLSPTAEEPSVFKNIAENLLYDSRNKNDPIPIQKIASRIAVHELHIKSETENNSVLIDSLKTNVSVNQCAIERIESSDATANQINSEQLTNNSKIEGITQFFEDNSGNKHIESISSQTSTFPLGENAEMGSNYRNTQTQCLSAKSNNMSVINSILSENSTIINTIANVEENLQPSTDVVDSVPAADSVPPADSVPAADPVATKLGEFQVIQPEQLQISLNTETHSPEEIKQQNSINSQESNAKILLSSHTYQLEYASEHMEFETLANKNMCETDQIEETNKPCDFASSLTEAENTKSIELSLPIRNESNEIVDIELNTAVNLLSQTVEYVKISDDNSLVSTVLNDTITTENIDFENCGNGILLNSKEPEFVSEGSLTLLQNINKSVELLNSEPLETHNSKSDELMKINILESTPFVRVLTDDSTISTLETHNTNVQELPTANILESSEYVPELTGNPTISKLETQNSNADELSAQLESTPFVRVLTDDSTISTLETHNTNVEELPTAKILESSDYVPELTDNPTISSLTTQNSNDIELPNDKILESSDDVPELTDNLIISTLETQNSNGAELPTDKILESSDYVPEITNKPTISTLETQNSNADEFSTINILESSDYVPELTDNPTISSLTTQNSNDIELPNDKILESSDYVPELTDNPIISTLETQNSKADELPTVKMLESSKCVPERTNNSIISALNYSQLPSTECTSQTNSESGNMFNKPALNIFSACEREIEKTLETTYNFDNLNNVEGETSTDLDEPMMNPVLESEHLEETVFVETMSRTDETLIHHGLNTCFQSDKTTVLGVLNVDDLDDTNIAEFADLNLVKHTNLEINKDHLENIQIPETTSTSDLRTHHLVHFEHIQSVESNVDINENRNFESQDEENLTSSNPSKHLNMINTENFIFENSIRCESTATDDKEVCVGENSHLDTMNLEEKLNFDNIESEKIEDIERSRHDLDNSESILVLEAKRIESNSASDFAQYCATTSELELQDTLRQNISENIENRFLENQNFENFEFPKDNIHSSSENIKQENSDSLQPPYSDNLDPEQIPILVRQKPENVNYVLECSQTIELSNKVKLDLHPSENVDIVSSTVIQNIDNSISVISSEQLSSTPDLSYVSEISETLHVSNSIQSDKHMLSVIKLSICSATQASETLLQTSMANLESPSDTNSENSEIPFSENITAIEHSTVGNLAENKIIDEKFGRKDLANPCFTNEKDTNAVLHNPISEGNTDFVKMEQVKYMERLRDMPDICNNEKSEESISALQCSYNDTPNDSQLQNLVQSTSFITDRSSTSDSLLNQTYQKVVETNVGLEQQHEKPSKTSVEEQSKPLNIGEYERESKEELQNELINKIGNVS